MICFKNKTFFASRFITLFRFLFPESHIGIGLLRRHYLDVVDIDVRRQRNDPCDDPGNVVAGQRFDAAVHLRGPFLSPWKRTVENSVSTIPGRISVTLIP